MDRIFEVDSGLSFGMILMGGCFTLHPFLGLIMMSSYKRVDAFSGGIFVGFSILNAVNALASAVFWYAKVKMASELATSIPDRVTDPLSVNPETEPLFRKLAVTAAVYLILESLLTGMLFHANSLEPPSSAHSISLNKESILEGKWGPAEGERSSLMQQSSYQQNPFHDDEEDGPSVSI
mmetsp:Transcript_68587/g.137930  ORF Transcript_68587/g.137930 Transcript_68587/m.137930 type:complete len:179 (-) Transcript_68587:324-860(-)